MKVSCDECGRVLLNVPDVEGSNRGSLCRKWKRQCRRLGLRAANR